MRLIDGDALKKKSFGKRGGLVHTSDIDDMQTVDAVPVVRCKNCESWNQQECVADGNCWCDKLERFTWKNFFCADGERRDVNATG